jgi:hypothetical protein
MGDVGRISGVLLDPKKAFADIAAKPSWIVPLVLTIVLGLAFVYIFTTKVGWDRYFHQMAETNSRMPARTPSRCRASSRPLLAMPAPW